MLPPCSAGQALAGSRGPCFAVAVAVAVVCGLRCVTVTLHDTHGLFKRREREQMRSRVCDPTPLDRHETRHGLQYTRRRALLKCRRGLSGCMPSGVFDVFFVYPLGKLRSPSPHPKRM